MAGEPEPEARRRILQAVLSYPGLRLAELARLVDVAPNLVDYHMETLLDAELCVEATYEGHRRFYPLPVPGAPAVADAEWLALLREPVRLQVALHLLTHGPANHTTLADAVHVAKSTLSFHLGRLAEVGLVVKEADGRYAPRDPARLLRLVVEHPPLPEPFARNFAAWLACYRKAAGPPATLD